MLPMVTCSTMEKEEALWKLCKSEGESGPSEKTPPEANGIGGQGSRSHCKEEMCLLGKGTCEGSDMCYLNQRWAAFWDPHKARMVH